jgi:YidC/Oxa1 family membrane protein insertase
LFLNFASGLNLYYFVQNVVSVPQQWMLAKERLKNQPPPTPPPAKKK